MAAMFETCLQNLSLYLPVSVFEPVSQPKLRPFVKSIKSESLGSSKIFQEFESKVSSLNLRQG